MKPFRSRRRGATLIEGVTAAAILSTMVMGLVNLTTNATTAWSAGSSTMIADNSASLAMQQLTADIRKGIRAYTDSTRTRLTVVLPQVNSEGDYIRTAEGASIEYYLSGSSLHRKQGTAVTVIGQKLTSLSFLVSDVRVTVSLTARQQSGAKIGQTSLSSQVVLRNPAF